MNDFGKGMMLILVIMYVLSPIDLCPGPIDDLIVILLGMASRRKKIASDK